MPAGRYDFKGERSGVRRGETFARTLTWRDADGDAVDLTGYAAAMQVKTAPGGELILDLTTVNGGIALGDAAGTIALLADAADTLAAAAGSYVYDLRLTSPGPDAVVTYLLAGGFEVLASVTE